MTQEELIGNPDYISMDAPIAKGLLNKKVGEEAIVTTEIGNISWIIDKIEYQK